MQRLYTIQEIERMRKLIVVLGHLLICFWLGACGGPSEPRATVALPTLALAPTEVETPLPIATPVATQLPQAAPSTQTRWPPDLKAFVPASARVMDVSEVDTDGDGVSELLVIYQVNGSGRGLVIRREGDNGRAYALGGDQPAELFQESWTANTVRDINGDRKIEIMVEGVQRGTTATLNIFQWNGKAYVSLLSLTGGEGIAIDDPSNSGILDFTALYTLFQRSAIIRTVHAEWRQNAYAVQSDVLFLLGAPTTFKNPEEAALAYYLFLDKDEPAMMFGLLTEPQKSKTPLNALVELSRTLDMLSVESLNVDEEQGDQATVTVSIRYTEHATQKEQTMQQVWRLKKENGQWRLAEMIKGN